MGRKNLRGGEGGGSLEIGLPKGGFTHLKIFLRGGSKNTYCPVEFAILIFEVS